MTDDWWPEVHWSLSLKGVRALHRLSHTHDFLLFLKDLFRYLKQKVIRFSLFIEHAKNWIVQRLLWRRGVLSRPITHVSLVAFALSVVGIGVLFGKIGVFSSSSAQARQTLVTRLQAPIDSQERSVLAASVNTVTEFSDKPRDQIIEHEVQSGETISGIAEKYGIDANTIRWANDLSDVDKVKPGQKLKILPVTGIAYTVKSGDSIYGVADKFKANPQAIADYWTNDIDESLKLKAGQVLIVPEGVPPTKPAPSRAAPQYVAQGQTKPVTPGVDDRTDDQKQTSSAGFIWPIGGIITQYRTAYHTGIDIAGPTGTPVVAAGSGTVVEALKQGVGYGWHVIVDHGNGYQTMYAHLSRIDVSIGDKVGSGTQVGLRGSTGRSTGPHLHFEVRKSGTFMNPLSYLK